jgi:hypothetical protein
VTVPDPEVYELGENEDFVLLEIHVGPASAPGEPIPDPGEFLTLPYEEHRRLLFGPRSEESGSPPESAA